jgi:hypothetical protein
MKASTHCLRIGVHGTPGHQRSGLYREYQKLHPNIEIVPTASRSQASYRRALRAHLACGNRADCQRLASPASYRRALRAHLACGNRADCQRLASPASYRRALRAHLACGTALDDIQAGPAG